MVQIGRRSDNSKHINGRNEAGRTKITCRSEKVISGDFVSDLARAAAAVEIAVSTIHRAVLWRPITEPTGDCPSPEASTEKLELDVRKNKALDLLDKDFPVSFSVPDIGNYVVCRERPRLICQLWTGSRCLRDTFVVYKSGFFIFQL